ncbi:ATP-binding cassette domain-containing protein [Leptospira idonii]|uniref:ABC transporter ATP-binding protein n=1 Tax=Leptospira idonii TaxID=1193500 RepID=A0A4V3JY72_9LEPT|nr:ATP-binding cassette domain-containing protein [Leptospira idonii]TGN20106.1 ABC transporter ATP-binding protein [Leptospira idonii]
MSDHISIQSLNFIYESSSESLFEDLNLHFASGWTGIVGKNGSGKSTLAKIISGEIFPSSGIIQGNTNVRYVSQDTSVSEEDLENFIYDDSKETGKWKNLLKIKIRQPEDYHHLSFGERRRILLSMALSEDSEVLILDEPTNHLDEESIRLILNAIRFYQGVGILISHDRYLLDEVVSSCVFLEKNFYSQRPGNFSQGRSEMEREREERVKDWEEIRKERKRLEAEISRRREEANLSHKHRSKKGLDPHDHDGRYRKNLARVTGKDGQAGRLKNQLDARKEHSERKEKEIFSKLPEKENLGIVWRTNVSRRSNLFLWEEEKMNFGFLTLRSESHLSILPGSRIAITGKNGSGKSTLMGFLVKEMERKGIPYLYLPQEFSKEDLESMQQEFRNFSPDKKAKILSGIHRLGSDPKRFSESESFSPGEWKKLFLSVHLESQPEILLLDEPTNHLDIKSLEALESSLAVLPSALVLVSHDRRFWESLAQEEWGLENFFLTQKYLDKI